MSTPQRTASIPEYVPRKVKLEPQDVDFINREVNTIVDRSDPDPVDVIAVQYRTDQFCIKSQGYVGVLQLPSGLRLQFTPKVNTLKFLQIWNYVRADDSIPYFEQQTALESGTEFLDIIGYIFAQELETVLQKGLQKGYVVQQDTERYLRGKLDVGQQLRRPVNDQFHIEYEELTRNNPMNQLVLHATHLLRNTVTDEDLLQTLDTLYRRMERDVDHVPIAEGALDELVVDSTNQYYTTIVELSKQIVRDIYYESLDIGESTAYSFLVNMNELFEDFIRTLLTDAYPEKTVTKEHSPLFEPHEGVIKPDLIIREGDRLNFVGDVKYKEYEKKQRHVPNDDYYQIITYTDVYESDGFLIYPGTQEPTVKTVKNINKQIGLVPLNIKSLPAEGFVEEARDSLREQLLSLTMKTGE